MEAQLAMNAWLRQLRSPRFLITSLAVVALALTLAGGLIWRHAAHADHARKDAAVRQNTETIALACRAAALRLQLSGLTSLNKRSSYAHFIALEQGAASPSFGKDFTFQGRHYSWPTNPFDGKPVTVGNAPGDYRLQLTWYGGVDSKGLPDIVKVVGYGHDGKPLVTLTAWSPPTSYPTP
jgi:hypothetical protein